MQIKDQNVIRERLAVYGAVVDRNLVESIGRYISLLAKWNERVNLTKITDTGEILNRHFGESMFACGLVELQGRLADVGSGAGFPGLALKLIRPEIEVTLIEASQKKAAFLKEVCRELRLHGVTVFAGRTEDLGAVGEKWDFVTARAVGDIQGILGWSQGVLGADGRVLLWVGADGVDLARRVVGWNWGEPVLIPKSRQRFIVVGSAAERST